MGAMEADIAFEGHLAEVVRDGSITMLRLADDRGDQCWVAVETNRLMDMPPIRPGMAITYIYDPDTGEEAIQFPLPDDEEAD